MPTTPALAASRLRHNLADFRNVHPAETIIVCGCGASLKEFKNPENLITIGVNDIGRLFNPNYLVVLNPRQQFKDDRFRYVEQSRAGTIFTQLNLGIKHPNIIRFKLGKQGGTDLGAPDTLPYTRNSPYVALCLALHMGAKRIGLIGIDFTEHHFFAETGRHPLSSQLKQIDQEYAALASCCRSLGVEVVNLSEHSRLTAFPKARLAAFAPNITTSSSETSCQTKADAAKGDKVFFVNYRFLSCGEVFTDALRNAARSLGIAAADAYWDDPQLPVKVSTFQPNLLFVVHGRRFVQRWGRTFASYNSAVWLLDEPYEVDDTEKWSRHFRTVFVNDPATLDRHRNAHYLPVAYDAEVHRPGNLERNYDVGFVGGYNATRERWLLQLLDAGLLSFVVGGPWKAPRLRRLSLAPNIPASETASLYQRTKIVVNVFRERHHFNRQRIPAQSLNPRVYEALACGALVVSEQRPELATVFPELPVFTTGAEMVTRVRTLIEDAGERERLLTRGRQLLSEHTYAHRLQSVLEISSSKSHSLAVREKIMSTIVASEAPTVVAAKPKLPPHWLQCGAVVAAMKNGAWVIVKSHDDVPGSEQGLASEQSFGDVELAFEVLLSNDTVFLAKIHQAEQFNQASNSYHLYCRPGQAFVAMHHRVLADVKIARNRWVSLILGWQDGLLTLSRDGVQVAALHERSLPTGYCFLGVKGGEARLRNLSLTVPAQPSRRSSEQRTEAVPSGWTVCGTPPHAGTGDSIVLNAPLEDGSGAETGLASEAALTQLELSFELKLDPDTSFIAKIHHQDRTDSAANSYHLLCCPKHDYLAKHHVVFRPLRIARTSWQSIVLRRTEHSWIELIVNDTSVARTLDNQLQGGFCFLGVARGRAELRNIRLRDLADSHAIKASVVPRHLATSSARRPINSTRVEPLPFSCMPLRGLIYHVWPVKGSMWLWNLEQLKQRIDVFNGRRAVGIVHDARSAPPEAVMDALDGHGCEFFVRPNDARGETITFPHLLREAASLDPNEITFYGHSKGVKYEPDIPQPVRRWAEVQYLTALDNWLEVRQQLQRYALTGPFRMLGRFRTHRNLGDWHYSGTFFWMRHALVFSRDCFDVPQFYGGVEAWPGIYFKQEETGCLFLDQLRQLPYHAKFWTSLADPALERSKAGRQGVSPPPDLIKPLPYQGYAWPRVEQKPDELDWWIAMLLKSRISRLLTIGTMHGGVEWHIARVFRDHGRDIDITSVDLSPNPEAYRAFQDAAQRFGQSLQLIAGDSSSQSVRKQLVDQYDAVFIDGDHGYRGARSDWLLAKSVKATLVGLHDIVDSDWHVQCRCCVSRLWTEIKAGHETDQLISGIWGGIGIVRL